MLKSGTQVTARPSGWHDPSYDGTKGELEGVLRIQEIEGDEIFPPFTLYTVDGRPVDPATIKPANLTAAATEVKAAGLAVVAKDTGRVLLLQRALIDDDPAGGKWEFPGGHLEPNEEPLQGAIREWAEETGLKLPKGNLTNTWTSSNNVYQGFVYEIPRESDLAINLDHEDRKVLNPDDPDGDEIEVIAWFAPEDLPENPALREEVKDTDWTLLASGAPTNLEFANPCHSPEDGRFCETHGEHSGAYRKAYNKARSILPDDPFQMLPIDEITGHPWLLPNGFPGKGLNTVEQKVTAVGKVLHNEIAARLQGQGILRPDSKEIRDKDEKLRAEMKEGADFMDALVETGAQTKALDRFKEKFPDTAYQDGTPEQREAVFKDIDKEFPGYLKAKKALAAYPAHGRELQDLERTYTLAYRVQAFNVLSEVLGGEFGNEEIAVRKVGSTNNKLMDTVRRAGQVYPDAWVQDANHNGVVMVKPGNRGLHKWEEVSKVDSKGYVKTPDGKIVKIRTSTITVDKVNGYQGIDSSEYYPTAVHELGHRFEQTRPHIMALEWAFWARRAGKEKPQQLRKLKPDYSYKANEMAVGDRYEDAYMGKIYRESPREPFESFQMGMQGMFGGSYRMWHDSDYASFILGILAAG